MKNIDQMHYISVLLNVSYKMVYIPSQSNATSMKKIGKTFRFYQVSGPVFLFVGATIWENWPIVALKASQSLVMNQNRVEKKIVDVYRQVFC